MIKSVKNYGRDNICQGLLHGKNEYLPFAHEFSVGFDLIVRGNF